MRTTQKLMILILTCLGLSGLFGCGGDVRNDQGTSFTFFGWFADSTGSAGLSGMTVHVSTLTDAEGSSPNGTFAGLQNNLAGQAVRVDRMRLSYYIPGASIQLPSTTLPASSFLGPASGNQTSGNGSTLPGSFESLGSVSYAETFIFPPAIRDFMALNINSLPELPFTMVVTATATGVTTAGNRITSNPLDLPVQVVASLPIEAP